MIKRTIRTMGVGVALMSCALVHAQAPDLAAIAGRLPTLPRQEGRVTIPLDGEISWRGVRPGVDVAVRDGRLTVGYDIAAGAPAGAALVFGEGSLRGARVLRVRAIANRSMQLIPTLQSAKGAAFALPALSLTRDKVLEIEVPLSELTYFPPQSKADEPDSFTAGDAVMLTLLDISGFRGGSGAVSFTIESIEGGL